MTVSEDSEFTTESEEENEEEVEYHETISDAGTYLF